MLKDGTLMGNLTCKTDFKRKLLSPPWCSSWCVDCRGRTKGKGESFGVKFGADIWKESVHLSHLSRGARMIMRGINYGMSVVCRIFVAIKKTRLAVCLLISGTAVIIVRKACCSGICNISSKLK